MRKTCHSAYSGPTRWKPSRHWVKLSFLARVPQALPISSISNSLFRWKKHCSKHASPATITSAKAMTPAIDEPQLERDPHLPLHYFDRRRSRLQRSGSHKTRRWRKPDSNSWSRFEKSRPSRHAAAIPSRSAGESGTTSEEQKLEPASTAGEFYDERMRQITNSQATPRTSTSKSRPCTGGRAKCQTKPPDMAPRRTNSSARSGWISKIV